MNLEPIRALVSDLNKYQDHKVNSGRIINASTRALPALSQLLEAVTNLEKLEQKWRDEAAMCETLSVSFTTKREQSFIANCARDCADELKRALHPEDK